MEAVNRFHIPSLKADIFFLLKAMISLVTTRDVEAIDRFHFGGWDSY